MVLLLKLGEAGAIVYVTGRSTFNNQSPMGRKETIEETAELVTKAGEIKKNNVRV